MQLQLMKNKKHRDLFLEGDFMPVPQTHAEKVPPNRLKVVKRKRIFEDPNKLGDSSSMSIDSQELDSIPAGSLQTDPFNSTDLRETKNMKLEFGNNERIKAPPQAVAGGLHKKPKKAKQQSESLTNSPNYNNRLRRPSILMPGAKSILQRSPFGTGSPIGSALGSPTGSLSMSTYQAQLPQFDSQQMLNWLKCDP
mmetsp:Transcript_35507/g.54322  ORF Transcript_35507/g.54322 Transcript_35507/m.54322 type:complete len:195 (+) Transcript_35507:768-1352(+)